MKKIIAYLFIFAFVLPLAVFTLIYCVAKVTLLFMLDTCNRLALWIKDRWLAVRIYEHMKDL